MITQIAIIAVTALPLMGASVALAQTVEDELRAAEDQWQALWAAKDTQELAALYAEDGMRLPPDAIFAAGLRSSLTEIARSRGP